MVSTPPQAASCLRYCKSTIFQANHNLKSTILTITSVVCDTAKVRFFKQITTWSANSYRDTGCLRYCKSTIFQANHNYCIKVIIFGVVVCDTAKVRFFKQITTTAKNFFDRFLLFAILQKYDFSSKSQHNGQASASSASCLRYCKSTIFQANHN